MAVSLMLGCSDSSVSYHKSVKPILSENCLSCHGGVRKMGDLNLVFRDQVTSPNPRSGKRAIVPYRPRQSELVRRISSKDEEKRMPKDAHSLSSEEVGIIRQWIKEGAHWDDHWAYSSLDTSTFSLFRANEDVLPIDHLVRAELQSMGLNPMPKANPTELLRRVSLDLTGLPPNESLSRKWSEGMSYEDLVDALLNSHNFGEHWAAMWLDLARYADSKGYEKDPHRNIWRYRDWVINALNDDMPFSDFTRYQLAGDLIPDAGEEGVVATAFHRNAMTNTEGGTDDEEFRVASVLDRLNTTFEIWQSTAIGCAQCHDHPYDPISQNEFYETLSFFNNTVDADLAAEYPVFESYEPEDEGSIREILAWLENRDIEEIESTPITAEIVKDALFPTLLPEDCDDFTNALIYSSGVMSNWTNNVTDGVGRKFYFLYEDISMDQLEAIDVTYSTSGDHLAILEMRLDSIGGQTIFSTTFDKTKSVSGHEWVGYNEWTVKRIEFDPQSQNNRDIVFEIKNPSGVVPDGILLIKQLDLIYKGARRDEQVLARVDSLIKIKRKADKTPIVREKHAALRRKNQVFIRGNQLTRGNSVGTKIPDILNSGALNIANRLDLADWLVSDENVLTARSLVNRLWEKLYGIGIVETLEDFGATSLPPSNQALLDYLAYQFVNEYDWSLKGILKEIVLSSTYCQSSQITSEAQEQDPYNRYASRGPRFRLSAEQIRDQALAVSGLLYDSIGGPSVMPYQPTGVWQTVYNNHQWLLSTGKHKYRRALYTYWKRSSPYPSMEAFDSPTREVCRSRRIRTNTPNQALVALNDPVYIEAANALGRKMMHFSENPEQQIQYCFEIAALQKPVQQVVEILTDLHASAQRSLVEIQSDKGKYDSAAAVVAHAVMNLDAFTNKS